ncbi:aspartate/glutamate racemase family protein [Ammoniphilus sp. YIM 78166]|uniref:aspartate/glutamate racemase family protein n=1 Tax=Ammoniphilus sp. YIM 78166 TaxID=1644106 RepID=UPI00106F1E58|nr:aspartate/glutamate racemase family protein [Ammoniphilus sp. YIM 78166]
MVYRARKGQVSYGEAIGILMLETYAPFIPGDVGNASTYSFPVRYQTVKDFTVDRLFSKDMSLLDAVKQAGEQLVADGVKAITGDCGYMALFQRELAEHLEVPVFMSSLLQVPFISRMLRAEEKVGILCASSQVLDSTLLNAVGIHPGIGIRVKGLQDQPHFYSAALAEEGFLNSIEIEKEVVAVAKQMVEEDPLVQAILLECSMLPPYAEAVQKAVNLPVFDYITMINYVYSAVVKKRYAGFM